jgi:molybdate transport system ATP-binding protein
VAVAPNPEANCELAVTLRRTIGEFNLDVSFVAPPGITILFGPSGSGKTSILDCVAGLKRPDVGRISLGQRTLFDADQKIDLAVQHRHIGYVFQTLALFPHLTALQNVEYGLRNGDRRARSLDILRRFRVDHLRDRKPGRISGGERQRVALARALVTDPCVLLLDEPLSGLDLPTRSLLIDDLREWNHAHRIPVLYVTHTREEVYALGERVIVLEKGSVLVQGTPYKVLEAPRHELIAELGGMENIFDATVVALHEREGTMTCVLERESGQARTPEACAAPRLEVPLARIAGPGSRLRIGIRAGDILLATVPPQNLSARNVLAGDVISLTRRDVTVIARVDCGVPFEVHLTPAAERDLDLHPGRRVWLILKTYSCHLLR